LAYLGEARKMKLWLDDVRPAPEGWIWVKTVECAVMELCREGQTVTHISLDNDLGEGQAEGYLVMNWLEERVYRFPHYHVPHCNFHTANPVAFRKMQAALESIERVKATGIG
jgi:hypothetical protein